MRIGLDLRWLHEALSQQPLDHFTGGIGACSFSLVSNLLRIDRGNKYILFGSRNWSAELLSKHFPEDARVRIVLLPPTPEIPYAKATIGRLVDFAFQQSLVADLVRRQKPDVMHFQEQGTVILDGPFKKIVTVMDLIQSVYPERFFANRLSQLLWRWQVRRLDRADAIIAISHRTKDDIIRYARVPDERVSVFHLGGPDPQHAVHTAHKLDPGMRVGLGIDGPYFLYVGGLQFNKNVMRLVDAFNIAAKANPAVRLVIAGETKHWPGALRNIKQEIQRRGLQQHIHWTGWVSPSQLAALYRGAVALVHPALYEGFGLTVLEAMAHGCPVVVSTHGALTEVVGDTGMVADPLSSDSVANAMLKLLGSVSLRRRLRTEGKKRSMMFKWDEHAKRTMALYQKVMDTVPGGGDAYQHD